MSYLLDTSILIAIEKKERHILEKIRNLAGLDNHPPQISFITYFEFLLGIKAKLSHNQERALEFLDRFHCLKASRVTAEIMAGLKYRYEKNGMTIPLADLIIASQVKENNLTIITRDKIFSRIEEINRIIL